MMEKPNHLHGRLMNGKRKMLNESVMHIAGLLT